MKSIVSVILFVVMVSSASVASAQTPQQGGVAVRESDSLLNGALIGAGAGVASVLFICTRMEPLRNCGDDFGTLAAFGAIGAGIGMGIDAMIRKTVYRSASGATEVHAAPIIGRRAKGLRLSLTF
jgi:hypothetical protein